jgi:hypothetical protein
MCARSRLNSSEVRLHKILEIIGGCRYSIHELSRTELDRMSALPSICEQFNLDIFALTFPTSYSPSLTRSLLPSHRQRASSPTGMLPSGNPVGQRAV